MRAKQTLFSSGVGGVFGTLISANRTISVRSRVRWNGDIVHKSCVRFMTPKDCNKHKKCTWYAAKAACDLKQHKDGRDEQKAPSYLTVQPVAQAEPTRAPTRHPVHRQPFTCGNNIIETLLDDPCYDYASGAQKEIKQCGCGRRARTHFNEVSYVIPAVPAEAQPLSREQLANDTVFVFIHVNKAAGTTVKHALFHTARTHKWDAAAYGTFRAWKRLGMPEGQIEPQLQDNAAGALVKRKERRSMLEDDSPEKPVSRSRTEPIYISCGVEKYVKVNTSTSLRQSYGQCKLRAVWGGLSMGLCDHFPARSCVYFIIIRKPLERAISDYNYFCIEGAEQRHKWTSAWLAKGKCTANIVQYFQQRITSPLFLVERLTRGCDHRCGKAAAKQNLLHPCLRYLLLDDLEDGLARIERLYGMPMADTFTTMAELKQRNQHSLGSETKEQLEDEELMEQLKLLVKDDQEIYDFAKVNYEKQWERDLHSCNHQNMYQ